MQPSGDGAFRKIADGGRTIRGAAGEAFVVRNDPARPLRLLLRTGGPSHWLAAPLGPIAAQTLRVDRGDTHVELGRIAVPPPAESFSESFVELPADSSRPRELPLVVRPEEGQVRTFHYWVLQPKP
jgi:hypothetical protein